MAEVALKKLTYLEFAALELDGSFELVDGQVEELVPLSPFHGFSGGRVFSNLDLYLDEHDPNGWWGIEMIIPTVPFYGRQPDFFYYSAEARARGLDLDAKRAVGPPTMVAEVLSESDPDRDLITKRLEYAKAGIPHYWILDPDEKSIQTLTLTKGRYEVVGHFAADEVLTSELFPGLQVPVRRFFR